jgi:hypothetical protein
VPVWKCGPNLLHVALVLLFRRQLRLTDGQRLKTKAMAQSTARSSSASRRPADRPSRCGSTTVVCSTRTRVSVPSSEIVGRKVAGRALAEVGETRVVLNAMNSSA